MRIKNTDKVGTILELPIQLANMAELDKINPVNVKEKNSYIKLLDKYKLFPTDATAKKKRDIVSKLKIMNFNENEIQEQQSILKSINAFNRLVDKKTRQLEDEIMSGKNVKFNDLVLKNVEKIELNITKEMRRNLKIYEKKIRLNKFSSVETKNNIKFYSGLNYKFSIKDGFSKRYYVDYELVQKLRRENKIVEFVLNNFEKSLKELYEKDKKLLSKVEPKKWNNKLKVYNKLFKVLEHNMQIATNNKYNKKFIVKDEEGNTIKEKQEYPILMDIIDNMIELYI